MLDLCFYSAIDPGNLAVLNQFRKGLKNPEVLKWPVNSDDPCGPPSLQKNRFTRALPPLNGLLGLRCASMAAEELIEVKFRLADGSDIGPSKYSSVTTVGSLKEKIISQWPKG
ncbi:hypothetical protein LXL04_021077 [Taraxacum kok-saghyz]